MSVTGDIPSSPLNGEGLSRDSFGGNQGTAMTNPGLDTLHYMQYGEINATDSAHRDENATTIDAIDDTESSTMNIPNDSGCSTETVSVEGLSIDLLRGNQELDTSILNSQQDREQNANNSVQRTVSVEDLSIDLLRGNQELDTSIFNYLHYREQNANDSVQRSEYATAMDDHRLSTIELLKGNRRPEEDYFLEGPSFLDWKAQIFHIANTRNYNESELIEFATSQTSSEEGNAREWALQLQSSVEGDATKFFLELYKVLKPSEVDQSIEFTSISLAITHNKLKDGEGYDDFVKRSRELYNKGIETAKAANHNEEYARAMLTFAMSATFHDNRVPNKYYENLYESLGWNPWNGSSDNLPGMNPWNVIFGDMRRILEDSPENSSYDDPNTSEIDDICGRSNRQYENEMFDEEQAVSNTTEQEGQQALQEKARCHHCNKPGHDTNNCYDLLDQQGKRCKRCHNNGHGKKDCEVTGMSTSEQTLEEEVRMVLENINKQLENNLIN